jgi:hypothetical protein
MAVTKALAVVFLLAACDSPRRGPSGGDGDAPPSDDATTWVMPDAAPPPFDAGPPPMVTCHAQDDAGVQCALPPSVCLDDYYLIYYTGGTCVDNKCEYETHWLYCYAQCWKNLDPVTGDGCSPGFT